MFAFLLRIIRHLRVQRALLRARSTPPFLILFVNSICNMTCEHCFYWRNLNRKDDLTFDEIAELSRSLGSFENLNLSGGEPFLRKEFAEICGQFITNNHVRQIYVPTNGYFTKKTVEQVQKTLAKPKLDLLVIELSLDGMADYHDSFRGARHAFTKAMETYDALAEIQKQDPRLRVHCVSTATSENIEQLFALSPYLYERCPQMDHHTLAIIRGDRKNPSLQGPMLARYVELHHFIRRLWHPREATRYGSIVEPMLQWAKVKTIRNKSQFIPCTAGRLTGVVYSNGDVSLCENHLPVGNLREKPFKEIWDSTEADNLRGCIKRKQCHCTTEVFMWPSIVYQPVQLIRAFLGSKAWRRPAPFDR